MAQIELWTKASEYKIDVVMLPKKVTLDFVIFYLIETAILSFQLVEHIANFCIQAFPLYNVEFLRLLLVSSWIITNVC